MFQTTRLSIRPFEDGDTQNVDDLWTDPRVDPSRTASTMELLVDKLHSKRSLLFVILETLDTKEFVGMSTMARDGEWGIMIRPEMWGRGFGREVAHWSLEYAFMDLQLGEVNLRVLEENVRAERLYRSIGFTEIGRWAGVVQMIYTKASWEHMARTRYSEGSEKQRTPSSVYLISSSCGQDSVYYNNSYVPV